MNTKEAVAILKAHNKWRRGADIAPDSPTQIGLAIDVAIKTLTAISKAFEQEHEAPIKKSK